jgi:hypothetical protein
MPSKLRLLIVPVLMGCAVLVFASPSGAKPPSRSLVGVWQRVTHCQDYVRPLRAAGFEEAALESAVGNGFIPGVTSVEELEDPAHPCRGAIPRRHSHFFTPEGFFGSLDWNAEQVDEGTYELFGDDTLVIPYGFEVGPPILVTFHYRIHGMTLRLEPVVPSDCTTDRCREAASWSIAVATPGKNWRRVG